MKLSDLTAKLMYKSGALKNAIAAAEETNAKQKMLLEKYYDLNTKYAQMSKRYDNLNTLNSMVMKILSSRRDSIIQSICERTEAILAVIFPDEGFKVKLTYEPRGKNYISEVFIGKSSSDGSIVWGRPRGTNGEFMKQLVSFSILASINSLLDSGFLFMDEPFSSSDTVNVGKMNKIIDLMQKQGLQLMFIEHKRELYESMPHMLIRLIKHRSQSLESVGYVEVLQNERVNVSAAEDTEIT